MSHVADVAGQYREEIGHMADVSAQYCALLERWQANPSASPLRVLLLEAEGLLLDVYRAARAMPDRGVWFTGEPGEGRRKRRTLVSRFPGLREINVNEASKALDAALREALGSRGSYWTVFDAYEPATGPSGEPTAIYGSLPDDLASVYQWLKWSLVVYETGTDEAIVESCFAWRFEFEVHAGVHLVEALTALHSGLWRHRDREDEARLR